MAEVTPITIVKRAEEGVSLIQILGQGALSGAVVLSNSAAPVPAFGGGCPCCSARSELIRALRGLLPRARRDEISRVVIDAGPQADPSAIEAALASDLVVRSAYRIDRVVEG